MDLQDDSGTEARFRVYAAELASVLGHADRVRPFEDYCVGLLSAEGRKSVEPLAAATAPGRTAAQHQSLLHLVAQAPWSDPAVLGRIRALVLPVLFARNRSRPGSSTTPAPEEGRALGRGGPAVLRRAGQAIASKEPIQAWIIGGVTMAASHPAMLWHPPATAAATQEPLTDEIRAAPPAQSQRDKRCRARSTKANASLAIAGEPEDSKSSGGDGGEP